jgi:hypothetical protein
MHPGVHNICLFCRRVEQLEHNLEDIEADSRESSHSYHNYNPSTLTKSIVFYKVVMSSVLHGVLCGQSGLVI